MPPENGAKPKPRMEPTSASRTSVSTPSSKQRAVSSACIASSRSFSSSTSMRVGIELLLLQVGETRPQFLRRLLRIIVEALAVLAAEPAVLLDHVGEQRLLARIDRLGAEIGFGGFEDFPGEIDRDLVVERERTDRHAGHARRHSRSSPPARLRSASDGLRECRCRPRARCRSRALSLTTIGVLRIARTKSSAVASASSPVFLPRMISTSSILSTGEKKWMPMNFAGSFACSANDVIGRVEVLEPNTTSGSTACAFAVASAFTLRSSNTASTIRSQPLSAL